MKDPIAIIPAAGDAKGIWFPNDQERTDAMVPISGKPAIYWTLTSLTVLGIKKVCIVVKKHGSPVEEFVRTIFGGRLQPDTIAQKEFNYPTQPKAEITFNRQTQEPDQTNFQFKSEVIQPQG